MLKGPSLRRLSDNAFVMCGCGEAGSRPLPQSLGGAMAPELRAPPPALGCRVGSWPPRHSSRGRPLVRGGGSRARDSGAGALQICPALFDC